MDDNDVELLKGDMLSQGSLQVGEDGPLFDTLDETIVETLMRDLKSICFKMKHILFPGSQSDLDKHVLRDWELWGPLLLCTLMALLIHHNKCSDCSHKSGPPPSAIFALVWFGILVLGFNFKMLALSPDPRRTRPATENIVLPSIFQLFCVLGYCLAPPCIGLMILFILRAILDEFFLIISKVIIGTLVCFVWPTLSSYKILNRYQGKSKIILAMYPIALFYFFITWMIVATH